MPELTFVVSLGPTQPPGMQVFGAASVFDYGPVVGSTACFPSTCAHSSVSPTSMETTFKVTFFVSFGGRANDRTGTAHASSSGAPRTSCPHEPVDEAKRYKERGQGQTGSRLSSEVPVPSMTMAALQAEMDAERAQHEADMAAMASARRTSETAAATGSTTTKPANKLRTTPADDKAKPEKVVSSRLTFSPGAQITKRAGWAGAPRCC